MDMIEDFTNFRAVVTCGYYHPEAQLFACAGYYHTKKQPDALISESPCPASKAVKNFGIYEIIKPYVISLDWLEKNIN